MEQGNNLKHTCFQGKTNQLPYLNPIEHDSSPKSLRQTNLERNQAQESNASIFWEISNNWWVIVLCLQNPGEIKCTEERARLAHELFLASVTLRVYTCGYLQAAGESELVKWAESFSPCRRSIMINRSAMAVEVYQDTSQQEISIAYPQTIYSAEAGLL